MSLFADTNEAKIHFFDGVNGPWSGDPGAIGTTPAAVAGLATRVAAAKAKMAAAVRARQASKNATAELNAAVRDMVTAGMGIVRQVRTKAAIDGDAVYFLARIPAPATPSPLPPPGKPSNVTARLTEGGALSIKWKCANPRGAQGTIYQVSRRTGGDGGEGEAGGAGGFSVIGATGSKQFTDDTVPAGVPSVTYRVVALRSTARGPETLFTVYFGVTAAGPATTATGADVRAKRAA